MDYCAKVVVTAASAIVRLVESLLFMLVEWYDAYMYSPLQTTLWPVVEKIPRSVVMYGRTRTVFTANIVSWSRTLLVVPIALTLKYNFYWTGFWCVVLHDFLDHLDGIVAKVQKQKYGEVDDPILGGFMDAFCDKIVNVLTLWSILMVTDFTNMSWGQTAVYVSVCVIIIGYEFTLGVVRVQDFFMAYYFRSSKTSTAAVMEGKLKEKLESMGLAALCVAQSNPIALYSVSGVIGITCLFLSIRLAHSSLMSKVNARAPKIRSEAHASDDEDEMKNSSTHASDDEDEMKNSSTQHGITSEKISVQSQTDNITDTSVDNYKKVFDVNESEKTESDQVISKLQDCMSLTDTRIDQRVECVYTIGCFDLFHYGHKKLLKQMRTYGKKVIVGVHDSRSIYQLKKRVPVDSTLTRMRNVKQYADEVFCVAGTDPTPFIEYIFDKSNDKSSAIYVRGDDMTEFPARHLCEKLMTIKFLPYTEGVSSTKLRKDLFNSNFCDYSLTFHRDDVMPY